MANHATKAKTLKLPEVRPKTLPKSLLEAAGLLRHKRKALERHLQKVRREWDRK